MKLFGYRAVLGLAVVCAMAGPAKALFDVKNPLSRMYAGSRAVMSGTISGFNPENHVVTVKPFTVYKGTQPAGEALSFVISAPETLREQVRVGEPVVVFQGVQSVAIDIADHWFAGAPLAKAGVFNISGALGNDHDETFPGKTGALVKAVEELKAGKSTLLDGFPEKLFPAPVKEPMTVGPNATGFAVLQLGERKINQVGGDAGPSPVFVVATDGGVHAYMDDGTFAGMKEPTEKLHLAGIKGTMLTAARIGGKAALIVDKDVYVFDGGVFAKTGTLKLPEGKILGLAIDDFGEDGKPAVAVLTDKRLLRIPLADALPGGSGEKGGAVDDDVRLTGTKLTEYHRAHNAGFTAAALATVDLNADQRPDLVLLTPEGTLTLLNRGFGGFLVSKEVAAGLLDPAGSGKPAMPLAAGAGKALWLLEKDGTLFRYDFSGK